MIEKRLKHLEEMHAILDKRIDGLEKTGKFSDEQMAELKKQRLHLKDEIAKITGSQSITGLNDE